MRLSEIEISAIKKNVLLFDAAAEIYLFGSRTNNEAKGGDIDLLVISDKIGFNEKLKIKSGLFKEIEEQKIDIVVKKDFNDVFVKMIKPGLQSL